ncbi:MAG: cytochrome C oxidase subunit IV family protein [Deltaproteobacteria bacterium]|nr:cytochrome C oxidase subunit IV family protein [Deltaproteobacteria bacterium]
MTHQGSHAGNGQDHVSHVLPTKAYLKTWLALVVLTAITVAVSYLSFGTFNLVIALLIATIKATVVGAVFMHLFFDHKFHSLIFASSIIFLGIFIGFTMSDTEARGRAERIERERPADVSKPFSGTRSEAAQKAAHAPSAR